MRFPDIYLIYLQGYQSPYERILRAVLAPHMRNFREHGGGRGEGRRGVKCSEGGMGKGEVEDEWA